MIKKLIFIITVFAYSFRVQNSTITQLYIIKAEPINPYAKIIHAIGMVEVLRNGKLDTLAYNPVEQATGFFHIRPIRLLDYNKRTGHHYGMKDMYKYKTSKEVFMFYASQIGWRDPEHISKEWNGSGKKTIKYWQKVKRYL